MSELKTREILLMDDGHYAVVRRRVRDGILIETFPIPPDAEPTAALWRRMESKLENYARR